MKGCLSSWPLALTSVWPVTLLAYVPEFPRDMVMTCGLALGMLNLVNLQVHSLLWPLDWLFTTRMEQAELLLGQRPKGTEEPFWT